MEAFRIIEEMGCPLHEDAKVMHFLDGIKTNAVNTTVELCNHLNHDLRTSIVGIRSLGKLPQSILKVNNTTSKGGKKQSGSGKVQGHGGSGNRNNASQNKEIPAERKKYLSESKVPSNIWSKYLWSLVQILVD